jgi:hypothetical protein
MRFECLRGRLAAEVWIRAEARLKQCWLRGCVGGRGVCGECTQFECWRLRAKAMRDVKEQVIVLALEVESAIALRLR